MKSQTVNSENISAYLNFITNIQSTVRRAEEDLEHLNELTQDYLHALELGDLNYTERAKVATKLAQCRKERRIAKDILEELEEFSAFCDEKESKAYVNKLRENLGKMRAAEKRHKNRFYTPRVAEDMKELFDEKRKEA